MNPQKIITCHSTQLTSSAVSFEAFVCLSTKSQEATKTICTNLVNVRFLKISFFLSSQFYGNPIVLQYVKDYLNFGLLTRHLVKHLMKPQAVCKKYNFN